MLLRYGCLFVGALMHILSNELHMLNKEHLQLHLLNKPHATLAGSDFFCYAYVVAILLHLLCDYYNVKKCYVYMVALVLFALPILSIISYVQYVQWFVYEPPISIIAAVFIMIASCLLAYNYQPPSYLI
jgi:hypothetical protein